MECFYGYKADVYIESDNKTESCFGLIAAKNYSEAVEKLSRMYGENDLENVFVELLAWDWSTFEVSKETYRMIKIESKERAC